MKREKIKNRVKALRLARGWTQETLASKLGCSPSKIIMIEIEQRGLNDTTAVSMANIFCVSVDYLLCRSDDPKLYQPTKDPDADIDIVSLKAYWKEIGAI
jgi:transcriptional regulator with XRE-family HTH domain